MSPHDAATSGSNNHFRGVPIVLVLLVLSLSSLGCEAGSYAQQKSIYDTVVASSSYNPLQRPLRDQNHILYVYTIFEMVSIVEINDVIQSFKCNGFLGLTWNDELLRWNASDHGDETVIHPKVTSVFRPLMVLLNTLEERDLFEDDTAPLSVSSDGYVTWVPGSVFPASCKLDLTKFPFDEQHCEIQMIIMNYDITELEFVSSDGFVGMTFFTRNGLWDITNHTLTTPVRTVRGTDMPSILISFKLKRKPTFLIISILLPIVFLSLLNLLVFVIPVESGEKISYGITVLLALTVFMSIMSAMLPSSSESMPLVISYIFILLTISVLTVVDSAIIVKLHHMEEKEERLQKMRSTFKSAVPKIGILRAAVSPVKDPTRSTQHNISEMRNNPGTYSNHINLEKDFKRPASAPVAWPRLSDEGKANKYKLIGKHIDLVSLVLFGAVWLSVTVGFMVAIAA